MKNKFLEFSINKFKSAKEKCKRKKQRERKKELMEREEERKIRRFQEGASGSEGV